jgi:hypothetical protein
VNPIKLGISKQLILNKKDNNMAWFCSSVKADTKAGLESAVERSDPRELEHLLSTASGKKQLTQNRNFGVGLLYKAVEVFSHKVHSPAYGEPPYGTIPVKYAFDCVRILCERAPESKPYDFRENHLTLNKTHHTALQVLFSQYVVNDQLIHHYFKVQEDLLIPCTKLLLDRACKPRTEKLRATLNSVLIEDVIKIVESYDSERCVNYAGFISLHGIASTMYYNYEALLENPEQMERLIQLVDLLVRDGAKISGHHFNCYIQWKSDVLTQYGPANTIPLKQWARLTHALQKAITK